jgi:hypothetical protein
LLKGRLTVPGMGEMAASSGSRVSMRSTSCGQLVDLRRLCSLPPLWTEHARVSGETGHTGRESHSHRSGRGRAC